jgi:hypothetical protein
MLVLASAVALAACSGARPTTQSPGSPVVTTAAPAFTPDVTVVLSPTTTTPAPVEPPTATTVAQPALLLTPAAVPVASTVPFRLSSGSTGILVTEALGAQPITASLDSGVIVDGQADCSVLLSGHRTSGIAPLHDVTEMRTGDPLELQFRNGPTCRYSVASVELLSESEAFRRVNLFTAEDGAALYTCADPSGAAGGLTHRWWVTLVSA